MSLTMASYSWIRHVLQQKTSQSAVAATLTRETPNPWMSLEYWQWTFKNEQTLLPPFAWSIIRK